MYAASIHKRGWTTTHNRLSDKYILKAKHQQMDGVLTSKLFPYTYHEHFCVVWQVKFCKCYNRMKFITHIHLLCLWIQICTGVFSLLTKSFDFFIWSVSWVLVLFRRPRKHVRTFSLGFEVTLSISIILSPPSGCIPSSDFSASWFCRSPISWSFNIN